MEVQSFALLCALATIAFTAYARRPADAVFWLAGLLTGIFLFDPLRWTVPLLNLEPAQASLLLVLLALTRLRDKLPLSLTLFSGGLLCASWLQSLVDLGYPGFYVLAVPLPAACAAFYCSLYRPGFRSELLLEEACLIVLISALVLALVPDLLSGWDAALGLQGAGTLADGKDGLSDMKVLWIAAVFVVLGGAYAKWKYGSR